MSNVKIVIDDRVFLLKNIDNPKETLVRVLDGKVNFLYFEEDGKTFFIPREKN